MLKIIIVFLVLVMLELLKLDQEPIEELEHRNLLRKKNLLK